MIMYKLTYIHISVCVYIHTYLHIYAMYAYICEMNDSSNTRKEGGIRITLPEKWYSVI